MDNNLWREIFNWKAILAFGLGVLLNLSASSFTNTVWASLLREVGTALMVAVFVWAFFEVASRRNQEERIDSRIERITKNVFFGVFRRDLPRGLIDEASLLILEANIIRTDFSITYTLSDDSYEADDGRVVPFIALRAVAQFTLKNIGTAECPARVGVGLPNPIQPGMREKSDVFSLKVRQNGHPEEDLDIRNERREMRKDMENINLPMVFCGKVLPIRPNEDVRVYADYVLAKELEDTEVLQSLFPTDGLRVTVIDRAPEKRIVRARSIHRVDLRDSSSPRESGTHIYSLEQHMLPYQGMILWWKARDPAAAPTKERPAIDGVIRNTH